MKKWPEFDSNGDLPIGLHLATLAEVLEQFGGGTAQRRLIGQRLERIYKLALGTGLLARFVVFGSFVTAKPNPGDVDIFMLMDDSFELSEVRGEAAIVFNNLDAHNVEGRQCFLDSANGCDWRGAGCA